MAGTRYSHKKWKAAAVCLSGTECGSAHTPIEPLTVLHMESVASTDRDAFATKANLMVSQKPF